ncbi:hypothetical protein [Nitrosomonas cryotolerans]|nr:hypothetical protein [Nitrosomonas cryotolerans]
MLHSELPINDRSQVMSLSGQDNPELYPMALQIREQLHTGFQINADSMRNDQ